MPLYDRLEQEKKYFINNIITEQQLQIEAKLGLDKCGDKISKILSESFDKPHLLSKF